MLDTHNAVANSGTFTLGHCALHRMGYGAMQLAGPHMYDFANRGDDELIASLARDGIAYVPFFPLGGFDPLQSDIIESVAQDLDATPMQVALAWLLQRSPNILLIPDTSSVAHLTQNFAAANLHLP